MISLVKSHERIQDTLFSRQLQLRHHRKTRKFALLSLPIVLLS